MNWNQIDTAPTSGVIQLAVEHRLGERRTFAAEASFDSGKGGALVWMITVGWTGWQPLHSGWRPIGWLPLTPA